MVALHKLFPEAPLYTSVYDKKSASWAEIFPEVRTSFLQKLPLAKKWHEGFGWLMPLAFETFNFDEFDYVISVTSEAAKGIKTGTKTKHISYILTPTRYLWSHYDEYFKNRLLRLAAYPMVGYLKRWDKIAAQRPDKLVAISEEVRTRIKKYYGREAKIIFPPVDTSGKHVDTKNKDHYLVVSRLDYGYKKVELVIDAFNRLGKKLVIVGTGRLKNKLMKKAKRNIKFAGHVDENTLNDYYMRAKALIMPQEEDFGIVAVEAQTRGVPVIAFNKGGAVDTVISGKTGIFFEKQKPSSLIDAVKKFEKMKFVKENLYSNAEKFSQGVFEKKFLELVNKYNRI